MYGEIKDPVNLQIEVLCFVRTVQSRIPCAFRLRCCLLSCVVIKSSCYLQAEVLCFVRTVQSRIPCAFWLKCRFLSCEVTKHPVNFKLHAEVLCFVMLSTPYFVQTMASKEGDEQLLFIMLILMCLLCSFVVAVYHC